MRFDLETTDDARRARRALGTLAWVALASAALWVVADLVQKQVWTAMQAGSIASDTFERWIQVLNHGHVALAVAISIALGVTCARLRLRARWLAIATAVAFGVDLVHLVLVQTALLGGDYARVNELHVYGQMAEALAWALLAFTLLAAGARRTVDRLLTAIAVFVPIGLAALMIAAVRNMLSFDWFADQLWVWSAIYTALVFAQTGALFVLARRAAAELPQPTADDEWRAAGRGLHLFASAVVARVIIVFCFVLLLLLGVVSHSLVMLELTLVALPLAAVVATAVAAAGMASYAHLPYLEGARRAARAVFALLLAALILDGVILHAALMSAFSDGRAELGLLRLADLGAQLAALTGTVVLLMALRATATHLARPEMASTATNLIGPVLVIVGGGIALRHQATGGAIASDLGVLLMLLAAIANIVVMLAFAKLAHRVAAAMGDSPGPSPARARYREPRSG